MRRSPVVAGTATVEGKVSIISKYGEVQTGADSTVYLVPVTAYATEWFDHYVVQQQKIDGKDPRSFASAHAAVVDYDGHFEFQSIPPGAYYVTCNVHYPLRRPENRPLQLQLAYGGDRRGLCQDSCCGRREG